MCLLFIGPISFAQRIKGQHQFTRSCVSITTEETKTVKEEVNLTRGESRAVIMSDDFSDTTNWIITTSGQGAWEIRNTTPSQVSTYMGNMASTTASNGFAVFNGIQYLINGSVDPQLTHVTLADTIDLSAYPAVILSFEQRYRAFNYDTTIVELSNDGGVTWNSIVVNSDIATNAAAVQNTINLNVSTYIGGSANSRIRFTWKNESDSDQYGSGYGWMIDDVVLSEAPQNDIVLNRSFIDWENRYGNYTFLPLEDAGQASFRGAIFNNGSAVQNNVKLNVRVDSASTTIYSDSTAGKTLNVVTYDTLTLDNPMFVPSKKGEHNITFTITQDETDSIPANNTEQFLFTVTDTIYGRDHGDVASAPRISPSQYTWGGTNPGHQDGIIMGMLYPMYKDQEINSLSVYLHDSSAIGTGVKGVVFKWDTVGESFVKILESEIYAIDAADKKNKWVTLPFSKTGMEEFVKSGDELLVGVEMIGLSGTGSGMKTVYLLNDNITDHYGEVLTFVIFPSGGLGSFTSATPFIRLNLNKSTIWIKETKLSLNISLYPNPASNSASLIYDLPSSANVTLRIADVTGKEIMSINEGNKAAGKQAITISTATLTNGIYFYTLTAGDASVTKKLVIVE